MENKIENPIYYFEFNNNFHVYNDTLFNGFNYSMEDYLDYPEGYKNRSSSNPQEFKESCNRQIEENYQINERIKKDFRILYRTCYWLGHHNPLTFYDHGFLAFSEGSVEEAMDCAEKYINLLKDENLEEQIQPEEMLLLGQSYLELNLYSRALEVLSDLI